MPDLDPAIEAHLATTLQRRRESLQALLRIPSISALPERAGDCRTAAAWLAERMEAIGLEHVEVVETTGHPVVVGDWLHAPDAPTVVIYGHYDVQPVDPIDEWTSPPFEPVIDGDRLLGRGAADDKGQIHLHLMAAEAMLATRGALPVNVRYLFEGDEESDSAHLDRWLAEHGDRVAADVVVISDSAFFEGNLPAITIGLRGIVYAEIEVRGSTVDLHSGSFGGIAENPANALARIIASLKDADGRVLVPGFYDDVAVLSEADRAAIAALPFDPETLRASIGVPALAGEAGFSPLERRGARPTLDVNGIWGGFQGEGSKTIIPAVATAKVSCRLVPDQDPGTILARLEAYVATVTPPGVTTSVRSLGGGRPTLLPVDHPATRAAARAIRSVYGVEPLYIREGGSIPVSATFSERLGLPVVLLGFTQPDDNAHAPDEWLDLGNYERGIRAVVRTLEELAALPR